MATRRKLNLAQVERLIEEFQAQNPKPSAAALLEFAEKINGSSFSKPKPRKIKPLSMAKAKAAVLEKFGCKSITELRKNKTFQMAFSGEQISLKTTEDWRSQYRKWIGVPADERNKTGPHCINGIDVFENFRPWHVFALSSDTASAEDIKTSFRQLAKVHHPDVGGDALVFERIQKMRDSLLALIN